MDVEHLNYFHFILICKLICARKIDDNKIPVYERLKKTSCTTDGRKEILQGHVEAQFESIR